MALYHLCQLQSIVEAQQLDPVLCSVLDLCDLLTGVGVDDLTGGDAHTLDQLHLCLRGPKGGGEEASGSTGPLQGKEAQRRATSQLALGRAVHNGIQGSSGESKG